MIVKKLIFSDKAGWRLARHLLFWLMYYLYILLTDLSELSFNSFTHYSLYKSAFNDAIPFLPVYLFSVYYALYFIIPRYFKTRSNFFLTASILFAIPVIFSSGYFITKNILDKSGSPFTGWDIASVVLVNCLGPGIQITGAAVIMKVMKDYSLRRQQNRKLVIENVSNKLKLVKMQIHPRILFESLHNISSDIDADANHAGEIILQLSELLSYLLYDADASRVSLDKEIRMVQNYIALKKSEFKKKLKIEIEIDGNCNVHYIIPGLLLSLMEIIIIPFEKVKRSLSVSMQIKSVASVLFIFVQNDAPDVMAKDIKSIQSTLSLIKQQLKIFNFSVYKLDAQSDIENFTIMLQLELNIIKGRKENLNALANTSNI